MSNLPQMATEHAISASKRSNTTVMGRQDALSVLFRSIGGELYKLRRRPMPKILILIAILITISAFLLPALAAKSLSKDLCIIDKHGQEHCISQSQAEIEKQKAVVSAPLRLPNALLQSVSVINFVGTISLIIIAGSIVGGEYGIGTIRLMLTRGPTRTQFLLAKVGTVIICVLTTLFLLILVGIIVGALLNLTTGIAVNLSFFTGEWLVHAIAYVLIATLGLSVYAMIALCLATLGKTTAAGIAGALIWWFLESVLGAVFTGIGFLNKGPVGDFLDAIPDYFIGNNIAALYDHQSRYLMNGVTQVGSITNSHDISDMHAILVLMIYFVVFIGVAWWVNQQRDITN
jgi:ABC-type transport system involved in multi-copper enzyme maturation permease subunit